MTRTHYINPMFLEELSKISKEELRTSDISFGVATRILEILERRGWSQADFAKAMGKREPEISKWLSGQHNFTIQTIAKIEIVLGEDVITVKRYRKSSKGYQEMPAQKRRWLSEPKSAKYK